MNGLKVPLKAIADHPLVSVVVSLATVVSAVVAVVVYLAPATSLNPAAPVEMPQASQSSRVPVDSGDESLNAKTVDEPTKSTEWFDKSNALHASRHEMMLVHIENRLAETKRPVSLKTFLSDFIQEKDLVEELGDERSRLSWLREEDRFVWTFCEELRPLVDQMFDSFHYFFDLCVPPGHMQTGNSPEFSIYWARERLGPDDKYHSDTFPLPLVKEVQEWEYSLRELLRNYLAKPSNLKGLYEIKRAGLVREAAKLDGTVRARVAERLRRISDLFVIVRQVCVKAGCRPTPVDFSAAKTQVDVSQFVGNSAIGNLVSYDDFLFWEIRALEFAARRFNEGGASLVTQYAEIARDAANAIEDAR